MRRRVPVSLPLTAIRTAEPRQRDGQALAERVLACQEAEVRLLTGPGKDHEAVYRLLDRLSELRLSGDLRPESSEIGAPEPISGPARANLSLF